MATKASAQEWFFYTRKPDTGKGVWDVRMGAMREAVLKQNDFMFMTVLEVDRMIGDNFTRADLATTNYRGPFYLDWDGADVMDAISGAKRFINTLETSYGVNPDALYIYLSGSKGVHVEVPAKMFWSNKTPPERGLPYLYAIYGDMARRLSTPCMDLRIYTGRKGRMWRRPNLRRENGFMKVPVTFAELCSIASLDDYQKLCSEARTVDVDESLHVLHETLGLLFIEERNNVMARMSAKSSVTAVDLKLFEKYKGTMPPTLQNLANGRGVDHSKGLNAISLQLAIVLHRFGITDRTLAQIQVEPLIRSHTQQPGVSHTNFDAAMEHFLQIFDYVGSTQTYEYSKNGLLSILTEEAKVTSFDLDGEEAILTDEGEVQLDMNRVGLTLADMMSYVNVPGKGLVAKTKDGDRLQLDFMIEEDSVRTVVDGVNGTTMMQVTAVNGSGERWTGDVSEVALIDTAQFKQEVCAPWQTITGDVNPKVVSDVAQLLRNCARRNSERGIPKVTSVPHEGLNVHKRADGTWAIFWAGPTGCFGNIQDGEFRFSNPATGRRGSFNSELPEVEPLKYSDEAKKLMDTLLNLNGNPFTMGAVLGWFVGCFVRPFVTHSTRKWPLLCVIGQKGTGKTTTMELLASMFYAPNQTPTMMTASTGTEYGFRTTSSATATIPLIMDEVKRSSLNSQRMQFVESMLHDLYTVPFKSARGGGLGNQRKEATHWVASAAPLAFIGEFHDQKAAVQERSVIANFETRSKYGREDSVYALQSNRRFLSELGRLCLDCAMQLDPDKLPEIAQKYEGEMRQRFGNRGSDRLKYNQGVMVLSLEFFKDAVGTVFGNAFDDKIDTFIAALSDPSYIENMNVKPEISQVLEDVAHLSHSKSDLLKHIKQGVHYVITPDYIDINLRDCFDAYARHCAELRVTRVIESTHAFSKALKHSDYYISSNPVDSELGADGMTIIRIDRRIFEESTDCRFKE